MRAHHAMVIVSAILVVFGLTLIFFSAPITVADASVVKRGSVDISEMLLRLIDRTNCASDNSNDDPIPAGRRELRESACSAGFCLRHDLQQGGRPDRDSPHERPVVRGD